jgi:uncharacterized glyoxalase superfamily protein PhnB
MPAVSDLAVSSHWCQEVLGFTDIFTFRTSDERPLLAHLRWAKYADVLLTADRAPRSEPKGAGVTLFFAMTAAEPFVDALSERARARGATIAASPADTAWNTRDVTILDPDGFRLTFTGTQRGEDGSPKCPSGSFEELVERLRAGR